MWIFSWLQTKSNGEDPGKAHVSSAGAVLPNLCAGNGHLPLVGWEGSGAIWPHSYCHSGPVCTHGHYSPSKEQLTCVLKKYVACMEWTWGLRGAGLLALWTMLILHVHWKSIATENARCAGNVYSVCMCSDEMEKQPYEIEPFGKVCGLDLIFLLGHSCLGL